MTITASLRRALRRLRMDTSDIQNLIQLAQSGDGVLRHGTLAIDSPVEEFQLTTQPVYNIAGVTYSAAAGVALSFTAAHVVTALHFGAILVQVNAAGVVSTLVGESTQTTAMAYDTAAEAIAELPAPAAGNVALGYILIEADEGNWTANTDSMTDDLTAATFVDVPVVVLPIASTL